VEYTGAFVCILVQFIILFFLIVHSEDTIVQFICTLTLLCNLLIHNSDIFRIRILTDTRASCDRPHYSCDFLRLILNAKSEKDIS
jgi:hypothetical protein